MKKFGLLIIFLTSLTFAQSTDLFFSEYVEGSSNNKALEIINLTGNDIDLAAGNYVVQIYSNGNNIANYTIDLTGTVQNQDVFVLAHPSASAEVLVVADQTSGSVLFNGDDAVVLRHGETDLDVIGQIGVDPGIEWGTNYQSTANHTLRRKQFITTGDDNGFDVFDPSVEWDGYPEDTFDGLGSANFLPVELTSFSAVTIGTTVKLNWQTATEVNNYGFDVERNTPLNPLLPTGQAGSRGENEGNAVWEKIGFVNGNGNSNSPKSYFYEDRNLTAGKYLYRLKQIDNDGQFEYSKVVEVDLGAAKKFELSQNYPNPFNPVTTIRFNLPEAGFVKLTLFNVLGQQIRSLVNDFKEAGVHTINLDASDLNSGIYIYKIESGLFTETRKMTLLK